MSEVAGLDLMLQRRHTNLASVSNLTSLAVSFALTDGLIDTALSWLEQCRCLVWSQIKQLRTPVDDLCLLNPALGDRFLHVAHCLEEAGSRPTQTSSDSALTTTDHVTTQSKVQNHVELAKEWKGILSEIRLIPGFHDFLQPQKVSNILAGLPPDGPVVIFNIHEDRCDALALRSGAKAPLHIPLANFSEEMVVELCNDLRRYLNENRVRMREVDRKGRPFPVLMGGRQAGLHKVLRVLWIRLIKPILDALGYTSKPVNRPRLWWCPTGALAFLPIHAAGLYGRDKNPSGPCVSDFVVSSYTPTVSALLDNVKKVPTKDERQIGLLLISQPATPGMSEIPATREETREVENVMKAGGVAALLLEDSVATVSRVEEGMKTHSWVHFACHAVQDRSEALKSGVHLHDGRLELLEIMRQKLPDAELAFLSACQTSTGDEKLSDEAVHLAAGMLAAGYRSVVGTMWSIKDKYGPEIATSFYKHLLEGEPRDLGVGPRPFDGTGASRALDHCTRKIRERLGDTEEALLTWVPYVHFGI